MNTRSLKFRLIAWYVGWLTVFFIIFGCFVYGSLEHHLTKALREALTRRVRHVDALVERSTLDWNSMGGEIHSYFTPEANNRFTRVTVNGAVKYVAGPPADGGFNPTIVPAALPREDGESFERRALPDGTALRVMVIRKTNSKGERVVTEEGSAEGPLTETLRAWLVTLLVGLLVLICAALGSGFLLAQRAFTSVDRITQSARRITSLNLGDRLPVPQTRDEIANLSAALNEMIDGLEKSFQHTRRFLADASHELRTPLTILHAALESMVRRVDASPAIREDGFSAIEEVDRLRKIVEGLFALSRLDAGEAMQQTIPFDLAELATTTAEQMHLLAVDKNIAIRCQSSERVAVQGDPSRMKQVIVNLLDNAIKYTPNDGQIEVLITTRDGHAVLEVADSGIGIPAEALPRVFERFYRVDKARSRDSGGAGLGLSIVQSICSAHGGRVQVESTEGKGARFIVELPHRGAQRR